MQRSSDHTILVTKIQNKRENKLFVQNFRKKICPKTKKTCFRIIIIRIHFFLISKKIENAKVAEDHQKQTWSWKKQRSLDKNPSTLGKTNWKKYSIFFTLCSFELFLSCSNKAALSSAKAWASTLNKDIRNVTVGFLGTFFSRGLHSCNKGPSKQWK